MNKHHNPSSEIYLEFKTLGQYQKVSAIDAKTGVEVCVTGPVNTPREKISKIAVQKLHWKLAKEVQ